MRAPQIIWIVLVIISLIIKAIMDGKPIDGKHSLSISLLNAIFTGALLYWGGFFSN